MGLCALFSRFLRHSIEAELLSTDVNFFLPVLVEKDVLDLGVRRIRELPVNVVVPRKFRS